MPAVFRLDVSILGPQQVLAEVSRTWAAYDWQWSGDVARDRDARR